MFWPYITGITGKYPDLNRRLPIIWEVLLGVRGNFERVVEKIKVLKIKEIWIKMPRFETESTFEVGRVNLAYPMSFRAQSYIFTFATVGCLEQFIHIPNLYTGGYAVIPD